MTVLWAIVGALAGSVANALVYRLPRKLSWWQGRSICPECQHALAARDLIPLVSYIWLRGECRYCRQPIGVRYFLVELIMALSFMVIGGHWWSLVVFVTVVIAAMDWETQLVSDGLVAAWAALVLSSQFSVLSFGSTLVGVAVAVGVIGGIWAISRGKAMGLGDVEIAAVAGLWLGWPRIAPALWISFVAGALVGLWLIVHRQKQWQSQIAFGPFLILGAWVAYLINAPSFPLLM